MPEEKQSCEVHGSFDDFIHRHAELLLVILRRTRRPTKSLIETALAERFMNSLKGTRTTFASMVVIVVSYARRKERSASTCSKIAASTMRLVRRLQVCRMARSLEARLSDESCTAVDNPISSDMVCVSSDDDLPVLPVSTAQSSSASRANVLALYIGEARSVADSRVPSFAAKASSIEAKPIEYITAEGRVRWSGSGTLTKAVMRPGPDGFATAQFPSEQLCVCEMTNLALPSAVVLKRPAARLKSPTLKRSASALVPGTGDKYKVMFYRRNTRLPFVEIGEQSSNYFSSATRPMMLHNIAAEGVAFLEKGSPETDFRAFVLERLAENTAVNLDDDIVLCEDE